MVDYHFLLLVVILIALGVILVASSIFWPGLSGAGNGTGAHMVIGAGVSIILGLMFLCCLQNENKLRDRSLVGGFAFLHVIAQGVCMVSFAMSFQEKCGCDDDLDLTERTAYLAVLNIGLGLCGLRFCYNAMCNSAEWWERKVSSTTSAESIGASQGQDPDFENGGSGDPDADTNLLHDVEIGEVGNKKKKKKNTGVGIDEVDAIMVKPVTLPSHWAMKEGVTIVPDPSMIAQVQQLMNDTWKVKYTRDRKRAGGSGEVPSGCRVLNVLRVENQASYVKLCKCKSVVRARRLKHGGSVEPFVTSTSGRLNKLDEEINEVYLFHGTSPEAADAIAKHDFCISRAGSSTGTMFGPGIYLAENASKSDEYAKEGGGVFVGQYAMAICRAVAGRVLTVTDPGDYSQQVASQEYDSVCGDRASAVGTFREMVFFSEEAVYTEYIAIYTREYD